MSDQVKLTESVLINGEVARPGLYNRDQFTDSQIEWLTVNGLCTSATPLAENDPADGAAGPQTKPTKRKRPVTNDTTPAE